MYLFVFPIVKRKMMIMTREKIQETTGKKVEVVVE